MIKADLINFWNSLSIVRQRVILGFIFFLDSYVGLTYGKGSLIFVDLLLGGNLPSDKKSIAINVSLQADDKTLSDNDLNQISKKIIKEVEDKTGGNIRS